MTTRHNLAAYEAVGLAWHHVPVDSCEGAESQLEELLRLLHKELKRTGAVAVHGNRHTDFVAALCAAYMHDHKGQAPEIGLEKAAAAGLTVTPECAALIGAGYEAVQPRSRMASSTSSGLSVTT
jgi:hypothetical protein